MEDEDIHPLNNPKAVEVPNDMEYVNQFDKTPEETYDILDHALGQATYPLLVDGFMLIDQVRIVEGSVSGHIAGTGDPDGFLPDREIWVDLQKHNVAEITSEKFLTTVTPNEDDVLRRLVFQFKCFWCGSCKSYHSAKAAYAEGWTVLDDPLRNEISFCPNPDCQEKYEEYSELYERLE